MKKTVVKNVYWTNVHGMKLINKKEFDIHAVFKSNQVFMATNKINEKEQYVMKSLEFDSIPSLSDCVMNIEAMNMQKNENLIQPIGYNTQNDQGQWILNLFYEKQDKSFEQELWRRCKFQIYYSFEDIRKLIKSTINQLFLYHNVDLMHKNIKPSNIINKQGEYLLTEGGYQSTNKTQDNNIFLSPQQITSEKRKEFKSSYIFNKASDIFSLGMIFVQACTLLSPKQLECFNDESYLPQESKDVLESIKNRYGMNIYQLLSEMTSFKEQMRINIEQIMARNFLIKMDLIDLENKELANISDTKQMKGQPNSNFLNQDIKFMFLIEIEQQKIIYEKQN